MWLKYISLSLVIAVVWAHGEHAEMGHEGHEDHEIEMDCVAPEIKLTVWKEGIDESCNRLIEIADMGHVERIYCGITIQCTEGIFTLQRKSDQNTQYVMAGCPHATVVFGKDEDCSTCRTLEPTLD